MLKEQSESSSRRCPTLRLLVITMLYEPDKMLLGRGEYALAEQRLREGLEVRAELGGGGHIYKEAMILVSLADALAQQGRPDEARIELEEAGAIALEIGDEDSALAVLCLAKLARAQRDRE